MSLAVFSFPRPKKNFSPNIILSGALSIILFLQEYASTKPKPFVLGVFSSS